ncbi:Rne/Rng family ribonuclease [Pseudoneobacillus sp. C159]
MAKIIVNYATSEKRFVVIENQKVTKLYVEQPGGQSLVGNIYLGIVTKVLPGMNAVFVDIGIDKQGFLHRDKLASFAVANAKDKPISTYVHQGERLIVQIEKDATGSKGPRLSGVIEFQGENLIYMPSGGFVATSQKIADSQIRDDLKHWGEKIIKQPEGLIFRTSSAKADKSELETEIDELRKMYEQLQKDAISAKGSMLLWQKDLFFTQLGEVLNAVSEGEVWVDDSKFKQKLEKLLLARRISNAVRLHFHQGRENIFSAQSVSNELEKALKRIVWLDSGACLVFDETEALTVIDVNSGKFVGKSNRDVTVQQVNVEAASEVARQIILRDLGGMILVDFIDMKLERERQFVIKALSDALKHDTKKTKIIGFTELGILQLTRRKTKPTLSESLQMKCPTCAGTGRVFRVESVAFQLERELWEYRQSDYEVVQITTTDEVGQLFSEDHLERLEETLGLNIQFYYVEACKPFYEITKLGSN